MSSRLSKTPMKAAAPTPTRKRGRTSRALLTNTESAAKYLRYAISDVAETEGPKGEVLSFGSGDCSQLGLGADENMLERKKPTVIKTLEPHNIVSIAAGSLHNAVILKNGAVFTWGCNDDSALGHEDDEWYPTPVTGPLGKGIKDSVSKKLNVEDEDDGQTIENAEGIRVIAVACGASHTIALSSTYDVYTWGTYRDAQGVMGYSGTVEVEKVPALITSLANIAVVRIAAGENHDIALTVTGEVYVWGDVGIGARSSARTKKTKLTPRRITFKKSEWHSESAKTDQNGETKTTTVTEASASVVYPKPTIVDVFAGGHSNFALSSDNILWAWGANNYNQLGLPNHVEDQLHVVVPTPVHGLPPVKKAAAGIHHSLFLTVDGKVYGVGRGDDGRLGIGKKENISIPTLITALPADDPVVDISCGDSHSIFVTQKGQLYTCGYGDLLQLGNGEMEDIDTPYHVEGQQLQAAGRNVVQAGGGSQHSIILAVKQSAPTSTNGTHNSK